MSSNRLQGGISMSYIILNKNRSRPFHYQLHQYHEHETETEALEEATRLAQAQPNDEFCIYKAITKVRVEAPSPPPVHIENID